MAYENNIDPRHHARSLYWQGWRVCRISEQLGVNQQTVQSWKSRDEWDKYSPADRVESSLEARLQILIAKDKKEGCDYKEIDLLMRQMERMGAIKGRDGGAVEKEKGGKDKRKAVKNEFSPEQANRLHEAFLEWMFEYQRGWFEAGKRHRIRNVLKARRIGGTRYFAREAIDDALQTGRSQIWLSASKAQAHEAKRAIIDFARSAAEIELKGDPIVLPATSCVNRPDEDPALYFLGTNAMTAQGYGGNFVFDEYFWVRNFSTLRKVASGMAIHKRFRQTYLSSPSAMSHEAYPFWSGAHFNRGRAKAGHIQLDVSHAALRGGRLCEDGQFRQIVTVEDAVALGCTLFDVDQLRLEYSAEEFAQLLMCQFVDDGQSVFPFALMLRCMVDAWVVWDDYKPFALRPMGNRPVWIGYDPSGTGDTAALVAVAPPLVAGGKFRILEKRQFMGLDFEEQAEAIKGMGDKYAIEFIGIDCTGLGGSVYQLVKKWFPRAVGYMYSLELKTRMVLKALSVISNGRLEFDAGWSDMAASFMAIKKTSTGRQMTFEAGRSEETSHADLAWATMHVLANEPLEGAIGADKSFLVMS
jgi:uncharacterized protein YjcR